MLILPEHMSSTPGFSGIRVAQSLIFCVMVYISLFVLYSFFFWLLITQLYIFSYTNHMTIITKSHGNHNKIT